LVGAGCNLRPEITGADNRVRAGLDVHAPPHPGTLLRPNALVLSTVSPADLSSLMNSSAQRAGSTITSACDPKSRGGWRMVERRFPVLICTRSGVGGARDGRWR